VNKNVDDMLDALHRKCYEIFDEHIPKATIRFTNHPAWYNRKLINLKSKRNRAFRKFLYANSEDCKTLRESKFRTANVEFESYQDEVLKMFYGSETATNDIEKANLFAKFFSSVYKVNKNEDSEDAALLSYLT